MRITTLPYPRPVYKEQGPELQHTQQGLHQQTPQPLDTMHTAVAVVLACLVLVAAADFIPVLSRTENRDDSGQFTLRYESGDGTIFSEDGVLKPTADGKDFVLVKKGSYSYTSPEGIPISLTYDADENGFRPVGSHLPVTL